MEYELNLLIELQDIDSAFLKLEQLKGTLPEEIRQIMTQSNNLMQRIKESEQKYRETEKRRQEAELEIKSLEQQLVKYKQQIYAVKTNREYDAITAEVETTEIEISDLETQVLELMDIEQQLKPVLEREKIEYATLEATLQQKKMELEELLSKTQKEEELLNFQRVELVKKIEKPLLSTYERIRKGKNGYAVVPIENGCCTSCFRNLPPQTIIEIKKMNQLIYCQTCGCLLVYKNNEQLLEIED
ncbi:hypothetical protein JW964_20480 [candidate division KSB1 bacterium]|nr:hypothetical protein [candidate division KSB1 bacterium]